MSIFIRNADPRKRTDDGVFVPDSWFRKFGDDTASVCRDCCGEYRVTTYADLGQQKRERQAAQVERKRKPASEVRALYVWVFHCPGFPFMGWWTYLIGRGISEGKYLRKTSLIDRIMELFPCGERLFPISDEWAPLFAKQHCVRDNGKPRLHAGRIQGKAPVWAEMQGTRICRIIRKATWPQPKVNG